MKKEMMVMALMFGIVLMAFSVNAFGASTPYWDENPLKLAPGESTVISLTLQNMVGDEDIILSAEITNDGDGIASLVNSDSIYSVPAGTEDVDVPINVVVPEGIEQGGKREITVSFMQISSESDDMVSLSGGFTSKFVVEVVTEGESILFVPAEPVVEAQSGSLMWLYILVIVAILIVVFWIYKKK